MGVVYGQESGLCRATTGERFDLTGHAILKARTGLFTDRRFKTRKQG
jgi:hypothetical protein